jgi:hypothetical protein
MLLLTGGDGGKQQNWPALRFFFGCSKLYLLRRRSSQLRAASSGAEADATMAWYIVRGPQPHSDGARASRFMFGQSPVPERC